MTVPAMAHGFKCNKKIVKKFKRKAHFMGAIICTTNKMNHVGKARCQGKTLQILCK